MDDLERVRKEDPFLCQYQQSDLKIASEFLTTWLPFLSRDLCKHCTRILSNRIGSLNNEFRADEIAISATPSNRDSHEHCCNCNRGDDTTESCKDGDETNSLGSWKDGANGCSASSTNGILGAAPSTKIPNHRMSWADMAVEEDELEEEEAEQTELKGSTRVSAGQMDISKPMLSREQRESIRFKNVKRKKDFICLERVNGKFVNIVDGLELHTGVFSAAEQMRIVNYVHELEEKGQRGELKERTYTAPEKWKRGKGRVTIQFGCCYNYAIDKKGNPPGILQRETVDPIPHLFKVMIRRMVKWHVLPPSCVPDSCIVNIYDEGDCIPPHIDNHDFVRPFCTVSFVSECNILFGTNLKVLGAGEFSGSLAIPLPMGSVLVLNGNAADVSKHCVPSVPTKRISITFRKMDEVKRPIGFVPEPDLQGIEPLEYDSDKTERLNSPNSEPQRRRQPVGREGKIVGRGENGSQSEPRHSIGNRQGSSYGRRVR